MSTPATPYVLGIDLGANSVGWAILGLDKNSNEYRALAQYGVRAFEAGVEGDIEKGKDESRAIARRDARSARRRLERLARRLNKVFFILQDAGLLPSGGERQRLPQNATAKERRAIRKAKSLERHKILEPFDAQLSKQWQEKLRSEGASAAKVSLVPHLLPYILRARALDGKLSPHELGRALYHLSQRRGFLSNKKSLKKDKEEGEVKSSIAELAQKMQESGARTLGEYFSTLDPHDKRIRKRWTSRLALLDEFEKIWSGQQPHHPTILTEELKKKLHKAIFHQRPLKIQKHLIGACELEPDRKRAPLALLAAQRFRLLQMVNDTRVITPYGELVEFTPDQRKILLDALETEGDVTFAKAKKLLKIKGHRFNWEEGEEKRFIGNRTAAKLADVFGERWKAFSAADRDRIVEDIRSIQKDEVLARRGKKAWGLDDEAAGKFASLALEEGYCGLSRQALEKILPLMEKGVAKQTAAKEIYGDRPAPEAVDALPPVHDALPELRNPAVERALTELRKVVNAVVRKYGKPATIRIELARDLRKSREQRKQFAQKMDDNRKDREKAAEKIIREMNLGGASPKRADVDKVLLWEECGGRCPYTGKSITMSALLGSTPQFDVEHIVPFSRSLDDSFMNKTLCDIEENRNRKKNHTPYEAYGSIPERWNEIIQRVKGFTGRAAHEKLRRFQLKEITDDFASNQLNDTRYASKLAKKYLGLLYGEDAPSRVQAGRGGVTAFLRNEWDLNSILNDGGTKTREDHRHHAVDAVVIALTEPNTLKMLSEAAVNAAREGRRRFGKISEPWPGFNGDVRKAIDSLVVSHRVSRKISGPLHEESNYSPPRKDANGNGYVVIRKPLEALTKNEAEDIVDPTVKKLVFEILAARGGDPKKAFQSAADHPFLTASDGRKIPIHKVRVRKNISPFPVGGVGRQRHVTNDSNHHAEIIEVIDKKGNTKWDARIISLFEAMRRHKAGEPIVKRDHGDGKKFIFSLGGGEIIQLDATDGGRGLCRIRTISADRDGYVTVEYVSLNDARKKDDIKRTKDWKKIAMEPLRKLHCRKVVVTPLGEVRTAND
jgi:CRISPR-associated endonuclease Csn1